MMNTVPFFKKEVEKFQYFQLPQWLFKQPYSSLSHAAKLIYTLVFDRLGFSIKNEWHDSDGKIFIYFTNVEFADFLNCSEKSVIKAKKELADIGLLKEVRQGLTKPNRIYILSPSNFKKENITGLELKKIQPRTEKNTVLELEKVQTIKTNNIKTNISNNNNVENDKHSTTSPVKINYKKIIDYLNSKTQSKFKSNSATTRKLIKARMAEGFCEEDFLTVIDVKCDHWLDNQDMNQYLRPQTLFGPKFESYLNQKPVKNNNVPEWSKPDYKETAMTADEEAELNRIQQEILEKLEKGNS